MTSSLELWLQDAEILRKNARRLKGGGSQDWLPHLGEFLSFATSRLPARAPGSASRNDRGARR